MHDINKPYLCVSATRVTAIDTYSEYRCFLNKEVITIHDKKIMKTITVDAKDWIEEKYHTQVLLFICILREKLVRNYQTGGTAGGESAEKTYSKARQDNARARCMTVIKDNNSASHALVREIASNRGQALRSWNKIESLNVSLHRGDTWADPVIHNHRRNSQLPTWTTSNLQKIPPFISKAWWYSCWSGGSRNVWTNMLPATFKGGTLSNEMVKLVQWGFELEI